MSSLMEQVRAVRAEYERGQQALSQLWDELVRHDVHLRRDGDALVVTPWQLLPADVQARVRKHKDELLSRVDRRRRPDGVLPASARIVATLDGWRELVQARTDGIALVRSPDGTLTAWLGRLVAGEDGQPLVAAAPAASEDSRWRLDPRPDMVEDSPLWVAVLGTLIEVDGDECDGAYAAMRLIRCLGGQLRFADDSEHGGWSLDLTAMSTEDADDVEGLLLPHRMKLVEYLRPLPEQVRMRTGA